jgi:hypothetical protein
MWKKRLEEIRKGHKKNDKKAQNRRSSEAREGKEHNMKERKVYEATGGKQILWWQTKENGAGKAKK